MCSLINSLSLGVYDKNNILCGHKHNIASPRGSEDGLDVIVSNLSWNIMQVKPSVIGSIDRAFRTMG